MRVGDNAMFMAKVGQKQGQIACSIKEYIEPEEVEEV
jgi:flagellar motor switch protein FliM